MQQQLKPARPGSVFIIHQAGLRLLHENTLINNNNKNNNTDNNPFELEEHPLLHGGNNA